MANKIILNHGGYKNLHSYQKSLIIYQITVIFCNRFLNYRDRTVDQMVQTARAGKQNIIEGSMASGTSTETEIKLTGVARASLEELSKDYHDYLITHHAAVWSRNSPEAIHMRNLGKAMPKTEKVILELVNSRKAQVICNMAICLINQTNYLLDQQLRQLENEFKNQGDLRECIYYARRMAR